MQPTGEKNHGGAQHFYIINIFVLLIIACTLVYCILITAQENQIDSSRENLIQELGKVNAQNDTEHRARRLPQAIIIGAKKCGTGALLNFIAIHPMVRVCHHEVHFFDVNETYVRGFEWYRNKMPLSFPNQITIEKSPRYFITKAAPLRILEMNPLTKIVVILREPVVRAISEYVHIEFTSHKKLPPFEELAFRKDTGRVNETWGPIDVGKYALHLRRWLKTVPRKQILILSGEKLIADPFAEVQKLEQFLGLEPVITEDHFVFKKSKGFMCYKSFDKRKNKCLSHSKGLAHPEVDPVALQKLRDFYKPYNRELYDLVGTNFDW